MHRFTPRMERALERASGYGLGSIGEPVIGTEHMLLSLLDDPDGIASQVLSELGPLETARRRLLEILGSPGYRGARP